MTEAKFIKKIEEFDSYSDQFGCLITALDRPEMNDEMALLFVSYLDDLGEWGCADFNGEGAYFGKEVTIRQSHGFGGFSVAVAYGVDFISVFKDLNHGYKVPNYLCLKSGDEHFQMVKDALFSFLLKAFGLSGVTE